MIKKVKKVKKVKKLKKVTASPKKPTKAKVPTNIMPSPEEIEERLLDDSIEGMAITTTSEEEERKLEERRAKQREQKRNVRKDDLGLALTRNLKGTVPGRRKGTPYTIDWTMVEKLCHIQCTSTEIAGVLGISRETLHKRCKQDHGITIGQFMESKSGVGKASLRKKQWELAGKHTAMAIFLGKNVLGQSDKVEHSVTENAPTVDYASLSDEQLEQLEGILETAKVVDSDGNNITKED